MNDTKDVELLALIFVYTLDLNIEESRRVDTDTLGFFQELRQADLVRVLNVSELLAECSVIDILLNTAKKSEVLQELMATKLRSDELR